MNIFSVIAFFHSISDALQVTHTPERGRFVVASRDIEVGECLIHEEAIVNLVRSKCSLSHCYNCQKNTRLRPVPCLRCAAVVFCSVQCRSKSEARYILIYMRLWIKSVKNLCILISGFVILQPYLRLPTLIVWFIPSTWRFWEGRYLYNVSCI